jgi:plastocyanin domain-containing protein
MIRTLSLIAMSIGLVVGQCAFAAETADDATTATLGADGVQRITLTLRNYSYTPSHVIVQVGKPVELTLIKDSGFTPHDLVIDDPASGLSVHASASGSEPRTVVFTPERVGSFAFYCSKKAPFMASHRAKGMEGVLEVRAD